jgi:hypothetical protein
MIELYIIPCGMGVRNVGCRGVLRGKISFLLDICPFPMESKPTHFSSVVGLEEGLQLLELKTGKKLWAVTTPTNGGAISRLSPDASRLVLASGSTGAPHKYQLRLEIWDTVQGKKLHALSINKNP